MNKVQLKYTKKYFSSQIIVPKLTTEQILNAKLNSFDYFETSLTFYTIINDFGYTFYVSEKEIPDEIKIIDERFFNELFHVNYITQREFDYLRIKLL